MLLRDEKNIIYLDTLPSSCQPQITGCQKETRTLSYSEYESNYNKKSYHLKQSQICIQDIVEIDLWIGPGKILFKADCFIWNKG